MCKITMMNKSLLLIVVFLVILTSSLTVPHSLIPLVVEGQTVNNNSNGNSTNKNSLNVKDIINSNILDSSIELQNKTVEYFDNASGYLVYPTILSSIDAINNNDTNNNNNTFPAVVMIHENKGLNNNIKDMANTLAKEGYVVLAVDLFNGEVTTNQTRASELSQYIRDNPDTAITNLKSAVKYLIALPNVNPEKIASLGWCFGGQQSLQLALNSEDHPLSATVIYYGRLVTEPESLSKIKWPVLGIFGDQDQSIPVTTVEKFEEALTQQGITNEIYIYKGVGHAFANPSGENYAPNETKGAWQKTLVFLNKYLD
jgi:carboxymethylenebutenolidase